METAERTKFLRQEMINTAHKAVRVPLPDHWDFRNLNGDISVKKALAIRKILEEMPLYIGPCERIVGSRTIYGHRNEEQDRSDMALQAMPPYINERDISRFGGHNGEFYTKSHYTPDYGIILEKGIDGIIADAIASKGSQTSSLKKNWLTSVVIVYEGLSLLIERYAAYAAELARKETDPERAAELERISATCLRVAHDPARDFYDACQLFWFSHLSVLIENFGGVNYGRVDVFLYPYYHTVSKKESQSLVDCLLLKMFDGVDLKDQQTGNYAAQHNITLGGVNRDGSSAVTDLTYAFIDGLSRTRLAEPEVACRIHSSNPPEYLQKLAELSVSGLNCMAYYNDDRFIENLADGGLSLENARDYAFDLCQDINIPGRGDFFLSIQVSLTDMVLQTMRKRPETFEEFWARLKEAISVCVKNGADWYNSREQAVRAYVDGNMEEVRRLIESGAASWDALSPIMSPLPLTSALYHGCIRNGADLSWYGLELAEKGAFVTSPVVGINAIAALKKAVYEEKRYTLEEVIHACDSNFEGNEEMRRYLWNCPKWCNDDDYVDQPAKEILEFACHEISKYRTPTGARHLCGIHQPHPVFAGWNLGATPEGRKSREAIPVTLSPENGTMRRGPTAAFQSTAKLDPKISQWNNCVMLQYYASVFKGNDGAKMFAGLLKDYFRIGGMQHQPNIVNLEDLKAAQEHPEEYKDLIIRMWGVSAHFVDLPKDVQDEFIARFENL